MNSLPKINSNIEQEDLETLRAQLISRSEEIFKNFEIFQSRAFVVLKDAKAAMLVSNSTDPNIIKQDLSNLTAISASVGEVFADANSYNTLYKVLYFCEKLKKFSEADRKLYTEIKTMSQNNLLEHIKIMSDRIDKKITVYQSILKNITAELSRGE